MGAALFHRGLPRDRPAPQRGGGQRFPGRRHPRGLGRRPLRRTSRPWRPAPSLPRPPVARRPVRHRRRRCCFRRRLSKAAVAIDRYWSAPRRSEGHDLGLSIAPISTVASTACWLSPRRFPPAANSPAASPNAAAISLSSSLDATFPTPTTGANGLLRPSVISSQMPAPAKAGVTGRFRSLGWGARLYAATGFRHRYRTPQRPFRPSGHSRSPRRPVHPCTSLSTGVSSYTSRIYCIRQFKPYENRDEYDTGVFGIETPYTYHPPHISPRIPAQRAVFTVHAEPDKVLQVTASK